MKRILLFMTDFFGYNNHVIAAFKNKGYDVVWYLDKINLKDWQRVIKKIYNNYQYKLFDKYFDQCIEQCKNTHFDRIIIIYGASFMNYEHVMKIKKAFPRTPVVYYAWDSVSNFPRIRELFSAADISYTFDVEDSQKYKVGFLPLFFIDNNSRNCKYKYDVSTVMSFYLEKEPSLKMAMGCIPPGYNKEYYLKLRLFFRPIYKKYRQYLHIKALNHRQVNGMIHYSRAVIDCPLPGQTGLTMRTFEVLAKGRKLITTNENIKQYDFYSPHNIFVVQDGRDDIDDFLHSDFDKNYSIGDKYSLNYFVETLIGSAPSDN